MTVTMPLSAIRLEPGESLYVDPGKMQAAANVSMITEFVTGIMESLKRFFVGGPNYFNNKFQAGPNGGWVLLQETTPNQIASVEIGQGHSMKIRRDRWIASSPEVELTTTYEGLSGLVRGTGVAMLKASMKTDAQKGKLFFYSDPGTVKAIEIDSRNGDVFTVDNDSVLGFTEGLTTTFKVGGFKSALFGEEGILCEFHGKGTVYVASAPQDQQKIHNVNVIQFPSPTKPNSQAIKDR